VRNYYLQHTTTTLGEQCTTKKSETSLELRTYNLKCYIKFSIFQNFRLYEHKNRELVLLQAKYRQINAFSLVCLVEWIMFKILKSFLHSKIVILILRKKLLVSSKKLLETSKIILLSIVRILF
jgi:hypothetical protein